MGRWGSHVLHCLLGFVSRLQVLSSDTECVVRQLLSVTFNEMTEDKGVGLC